MSGIEDRVSTLLGLIVLVNSPSLTLTPTGRLFESAAADAVISHLEVGDNESAFRVFNHTGIGVQGVIYSHLLYISNKGYKKYKLELDRYFN